MLKQGQKLVLKSATQEGGDYFNTYEQKLAF